MNIRFSLEESELINSFSEEYKETPSKETLITDIEKAKANTDEPDLIEIATGTINKIRSLDDETYNKVLADLPINSFTTY